MLCIFPYAQFHLFNTVLSFSKDLSETKSLDAGEFSLIKLTDLSADYLTKLLSLPFFF